MNKQTHYWMVYICQNCGTEHTEEIEKGKSAPFFVDAIPHPEYGESMALAPECEYCGCKNWSAPRKPRE